MLLPNLSACVMAWDMDTFTFHHLSPAIPSSSMQKEAKKRHLMDLRSTHMFVWTKHRTFSLKKDKAGVSDVFWPYDLKVSSLFRLISCSLTVQYTTALTGIQLQGPLPASTPLCPFCPRDGQPTQVNILLHPLQDQQSIYWPSLVQNNGPPTVLGNSNPNSWCGPELYNGSLPWSEMMAN